jgi:hypothetical protein
MSNEKNCVKEHIKFFADENDNLTQESMEYGHRVCPYMKKIPLKAKIKAICNLMDNKPYTVETLIKIINPASTGIWNSDGTFNESKFNCFVKRYGHLQIYGGEEYIITEQDYKNFLDDQHGNKDYGIACYIGYILPIRWKRITQGSIYELIEYFGDTEYEGKKAITSKKLFEFYTNPSKFMNDKIKEIEMMNKIEEV